MSQSQSKLEIAGKMVLVTGGGGFVGSNLVDALIARGTHVKVLDISSPGVIANLKDAKATGQMEFIEGTILNVPLVEKVVSHADVVFHLAAQSVRVGFENPQLVNEINVTGTLNMLQAARSAGDKIQRFVFVSSAEVYGTARQLPMPETHPLQPGSIYGASKLAGEHYARIYHETYGLPIVILRPFNMYGYRSQVQGINMEVIPRFLIRILNGLPPSIFGDGSQSKDFVFVTDAVECFIQAAQSDSLIGQPVNVAFGESISVRQIAEQLLKILGREELGIDWQGNRTADISVHCADMTRLYQATSYRPTISMEEGLKRFSDWFQQHYPQPAQLLQTH